MKVFKCRLWSLFSLLRDSPHVFLPFGLCHPLSRYSPLHNLPHLPYSGPPYPAVLLLTADHDDRVVPLHTLKFCATLQYGVGSSSVQRQPLMVRVDTRSGHGAGKPTAKAILEDTHIMSFIAETLGLKWREWWEHDSKREVKHIFSNPGFS